MTEFRVSALATTAVKGTHIEQVQEIELGPHGARGDRRFFLLNEKNHLFNGKLSSALHAVHSHYDEAAGTLSLQFPDGTVVEDEVKTGPEIWARVYGERWSGLLVEGPWASALSELTGRELRMLITDSAVDRGLEGAISLMSAASVRRVAEQAGEDDIDGRRFRMLIEVEGPEANAEDGWIGRSAQVGAAAVRFEGHVGRCQVTTFDPDTGERDLPTLDLLRSYRSGLPTTEPLALGVYGRVLEGGRVRVGDAVVLGQ